MHSFEQMTSALEVGMGYFSGFATGSFMVVQRNRDMDAYSKSCS